VFKKLEQHKKVLMAPLLQRHQLQRQQEIQHKQPDKKKADKGKARPPLFFIFSFSTAMDCWNALPLFHPL
jgi:hypothetical protein